jgi:hypothetical protein
MANIKNRNAIVAISTVTLARALKAFKRLFKLGSFLFNTIFFP